MMTKINYFINQDLQVNGDTKLNRNYECFGWWLPDLLSDVIYPPIGSADFHKSEEYDSGVFEKSQLVSDDSLTSGSQWDKADLNSKVTDSENENSNQKQELEEENVVQNEFNEENIRYSIKNSIPSKKCSSNVESETLIKYENRNKSIISMEQLIALINSNLPDCKQFDEILQSVSTSNLHSALPLNTSSPSKTHKKRKKTGFCMKPLERACETELEKLVLTVEHEATDRDLDESRARFLKVANGLDSRLTALEMDTLQLHNDLRNLQRDFQMQEHDVTRMIQEARRLVSDLQNLHYLDDLIFLLQGQLDRITLQNWPFLLAHVLPQKDSTQELNLVV